MFVFHLNLTVIVVLAVIAALIIFPGGVKLVRTWGKQRVQKLESDNPALAFDPQIQKLRELYTKIQDDTALLEGLYVELEREVKQIQAELPGIRQRAAYAKSKGDMATAEVLATKYLTMSNRLKKLLGEDGVIGELEQAKKDVEASRQHEQDVKLQLDKLILMRDEAVQDAKRLKTREEVYNKLSTHRIDSIDTELKHVMDSLKERKARVEGKARQYENSADVRERRLEQDMQKQDVNDFLNSL
jgi:phage shock protein A